MTPRRRGAHCELTFHSFSRETRSRVVLLLPSYSCTSPTIIYLEIRGPSPSQALIPRSSGAITPPSHMYVSVYIYVYILYIHIFSTPFYFRRALSSSLFLSFPFLSFPPRFGSPFRERGCSPSTIYLACPVNGTGEGHVCARVRA